MPLLPRYCYVGRPRCCYYCCWRVLIIVAAAIDTPYVMPFAAARLLQLRCYATPFAAFDAAYALKMPRYAADAAELRCFAIAARCC